MISSIRHKQSISWTFSNDAMAISAKQMPKNHTDKERFAATSSCIEKGILTLLFPRKRRRSSPSPFISHRVLEAVASRILKSLMSSYVRDAVPVNSHNLSLAHHRVSSSSVVQHPTRSRRVVGSNPIWDSDLFRVYVSPRIYITSRSSDSYLKSQLLSWNTKHL